MNLSEEAIGHFVFVSGGDLRTALNALELAVLTTPPAADGSITVDLSVAEQSVQRKAMSVDESLYYDIISAFCKSLRGSDPDAALYYAMREIFYKYRAYHKASVKGKSVGFSSLPA